MTWAFTVFDGVADPGNSLNLEAASLLSAVAGLTYAAGQSFPCMAGKNLRRRFSVQTFRFDNAGLGEGTANLLVTSTDGATAVSVVGIEPVTVTALSSPCGAIH